MKIVKLQPLKNSRVRLVLEGGSKLTVSIDQVLKHRLQIGAAVTSSLQRQLRQATDMETLFAKAINLISYRPRSRGEISDYLKRRNASLAVIGKIITKLERLEYLDDNKFARWWIQQRLKHRPKGVRALEAELRQKNIDAGIINSAIKSLKVSSFEREQATAIIVKKLKSWRQLPLIKQKQRIAAALARRGFSTSIVRELVDGLPSEE
jgi:regulatory protein